MNTVEFLDAVKRRHGLSSDYALAKRMGWNTARVSIYRAGRRELDDEGCVQIAAELGVPPAYVMASIAAARAKSASIKKHWQEAAKLLKQGTAAAILATALLIAQPAPRAAAASPAAQLDSVYIMRPRRRRLGERTRWRRRRRKLRTVTAGAA